MNKALAVLCFAALYVSGCNASRELTARELILQNKKLTSEEKSYAIRVYDWGALKSDWKNQAQFKKIDPNILGSEGYRKWGFGEKGDLTPEEKIYVLRIPSMITALQHYSSIDLSQVSAAEKGFVRDIHRKYGTSLFDWRTAVTKENNGTISADQEEFFSMIEVVSGHKQFDDQDLVFWYRISEIK